MNRIIKVLAPLIILTTITACDGDSNSSNNVEAVSEDVMPTTIVDVAVENGNFTTLVAALEATGLDAVLADPAASYTVFAPTDAAFALLGDDTINALLADPDTLSDILLYHVLAGEVNAAAAIASAGSTVQTANEDFMVYH